MSTTTAPAARRCTRCAARRSAFGGIAHEGLFGHPMSDKPASGPNLPCVHVALAEVLATGEERRAEYFTALGSNDGEVILRSRVVRFDALKLPSRRVVGLFAPAGHDLHTSIYDEVAA